MPITDWPSQERPREKLLSQGPSQLSHAELLATLFRVGVSGHTALDVARDALNKLGGLRGVLDADLNTFAQIKGLGITKYLQLQASLELGRRYLQTRLERQDALVNTAATQEYLRSKLRHYSHEVFAILSLDNKNQIIDYRELFFGTINHAVVHPRIVVKHALHQNAAAVIFAHNHTSGSVEPSQADLESTQELQQALNLVEIRVLDHIIVGDSTCFSFAENGLMMKFDELNSTS